MIYNPFPVFAWDMQRHVNIMTRKTAKREYVNQLQAVCARINRMSADASLPAEQYVPILAELRDLLDRHLAVDRGSFSFVRRGKHRIEALERAAGWYRFTRDSDSTAQDELGGTSGS